MLQDCSAGSHRVVGQRTALSWLSCTHICEACMRAHRRMHIHMHTYAYMHACTHTSSAYIHAYMLAIVCSVQMCAAECTSGRACGALHYLEKLFPRKAMIHGRRAALVHSVPHSGPAQRP